MQTLLIKNILLDNRKVNILIEGNRFKSTDVPQNVSADTVIDGEGKAILPAFYNTHTHAAMTLLRGYAGDKALMDWLQNYIWPYEAKMTPDDMHEGNALAAEEFIKTGTVFYNDMYFVIEKAFDVVQDSGLRAALGITLFDSHGEKEINRRLSILEKWEDPTHGRISLTLCPHAIYTAGDELYKRCSRIARDKGLMLHTHLSETQEEVENCIKAHGMRPVKYLDSLGILDRNVILAHCVYVDEEEWDILAERGVSVAHCPCSNMKLGSGRFPYELAIKSGCRITLGTDGDSSNNNLDMREEMKFASLLAKVTGDPQLLPAKQVFEWATKNGAEAFGIDAGVIAEGKIADAILVDMNDVKMRPCHDLISNWVYSADSSCIREVICDGKIIKKQ